MNKKALTLSLVLGVALVAGMFIFAYLSSMELLSSGGFQDEKPFAKKDAQKTSQQSKPLQANIVDHIDAKHSFVDSYGGMHTLAGAVLLSVPCDVITYNTASLNNGKEVRVMFETHANPSNGCAAQKTPRPFKVSFKGVKDAHIETYVMDRPVPLHLTEVSQKDLTSDVAI